MSTSAPSLINIRDNGPGPVTSAPDPAVAAGSGSARGSLTDRPRLSQLSTRVVHAWR